jgi:hypothetical protein
MYRPPARQKMHDALLILGLIVTTFASALAAVALM